MQKGLFLHRKMIFEKLYILVPSKLNILVIWIILLIHSLEVNINTYIKLTLYTYNVKNMNS